MDGPVNPSVCGDRMIPKPEPQTGDGAPAEPVRGIWLTDWLTDWFTGLLAGLLAY